MQAARTRIKVCGITRPADAAAAAALGADALGLVFYEPSPRAVTIERARAIARAVPPLVTLVGLFVDADADRVKDVLGQVPLGLLQFHGDEAPAYCSAFDRPFLKALRMREGLDAAAAAAPWSEASGLLLDSYRPGVPGGTGETFDWARVPQALPVPLVLAGGLDADNVGAAMARLRPAAVDVSGGVEERPGIKDPARIARFMAAVRAADDSEGPEQVLRTAGAAHDQ